MENIAQKLHHIAYITWDMAKTAQFWTEVMGLELVGHVSLPKVPSTGEDYPYLHLFFNLADGGELAFFEVRNVPQMHQEVGISSALKHLSFEVASEQDLDEYRQRLEARHIAYSCPEEDSFNRYIYFFDPNEIKVQISLPLRTPKAGDAAAAQRLVEEWLAQHADASFPLGLESAVV